MKVYCVIVSYNGLKWIEKCLKNIVDQCEIILVDNNSTDATIKFVKEKFPTVFILEQSKNLGFGRANNIGISHAIQNGADGVFLLNQDAYAESNCIQNIVEVYKNNQEYGIVSPVHFNGNGTALDFSFQKLTPMSNLISDLIVRNFTSEVYDFEFINAAAWFIPKKVFYKVGGFDPIFFMYGEDDNFSQRVIYNGFKVGVTPNAKIYHDSTNSNYNIGIVGSKKYYRQFINKAYVKYADVNNFECKKVKNFKRFLLIKAIQRFIFFKFKESEILFKKYKLFNIKIILKSVNINSVSASNYLDI